MRTRDKEKDFNFHQEKKINQSMNTIMSKKMNKTE